MGELWKKLTTVKECDPNDPLGPSASKEVVPPEMKKVGISTPIFWTSFSALEIFVALFPGKPDRVILNPNWFQSHQSICFGFGGIVVAIIAFYSWRAYLDGTTEKELEDRAIGLFGKLILIFIGLGVLGALIWGTFALAGSLSSFPVWAVVIIILLVILIFK